MKYYLHLNGQQTGPFTLDELKQQNITPGHLVWYEGAPAWLPAAQVPDLETALPPAVPPPLPTLPPPVHNTQAMAACFYCQQPMPAEATHCSNCKKLRKDIRECQLASRWLLLTTIIGVAGAFFFYDQYSKELNKLLYQNTYSSSYEALLYIAAFSAVAALMAAGAAIVYARMYAKKMKSRWVS